MPPSQGIARREITAAIERYLLSDDPWEDEEGEPPDAPLNVRANGIYERFRAAGWLRQDRVGAREMVTMVRLVAQLLSTLLEFGEQGPTFVAAKVRSPGVEGRSNPRARRASARCASCARANGVCECRSACPRHSPRR